jgi:integrase
MIRALIEGKWRRVKANYGKSGRVVPGLVIYKGQELQLPDVAYELRFYERGRPQYLPAGRNASDAEEQRKVLAARRSVRSAAEAAGVKIEFDSNRRRLKEWAKDYIAKRSIKLQRDQIQRVEYVTALFFETCKKTYIDELTESDLLNFLQFLSTLPLLRNARRKPSIRRNAAQRRTRCPVKHGLISARTIFNYYMVACKWLREGGVDSKIMPSPPKYEEPEITIYTPDQIKDLFAVVTGNLRIAAGLMLKCGLRRREVAFAYFSDINFSDRTILVKGKPERNFRVKNGIQRYVPVPDDLLDELRHWAAEHPGQLLIIQTAKSQPELGLIKKLKRYVYLHGLRCGRCAHCRSGNPECEDWELHKFRRTYITGIVRHVDLRTAQGYAGHLRITSTERYLKAASAKEGQKRVSGIDWTKSFYD